MTLLTRQGSALLLGQAAHPWCCHSALPPCLDHRAEANLLPSHPEGFSTGTETGPTLAGVQPRLIQGIRSGDGVGDLFIYKYLSKI